MIPKIIHLCWLSGERYPKKIRRCIESWKKYLPDYEIMLWDNERFDVNSTPWTKQAFEAKKYAFAADYIRLYAVYNYGGIYLDSDVEVIRSFDDVLDLPYFVCSETRREEVEVAAFGAEKGCRWIKDCLDYYQGRNFINQDGSREMEVQPKLLSRIIHEKYNWVQIENMSEFDTDPSNFCILPCDWFGAHPIIDDECVYMVTENTHSIHHYANSWMENKYPGGLLHKLYYKITGQDWRLTDRYFTLYEKQKKKKK